jgi:hypothetical protein
MSRQLISMFLTLSILCSPALSQNQDGLMSISTEINSLLNELKKPNYKNQERLKLIRQTKSELGEYFYQLMRENKANDDTQFSAAFKGLANLSQLSKIKLDQNQKISEDSCAAIKSQYSILTVSGQEGKSLKLTSSDLLAKELLDLMCANK